MERPPLTLAAGIPRSLVTAAGVVFMAFWVVALAVLFGRLAWRYPLFCTGFLALVGSVFWMGFWGPINLVIITGIVGLAWSGLHHRSYEAVIGRRLRSEWVRFHVYGYRWPKTMDFSGLSKTARASGGRVFRPKLLTVRSELGRDWLEVKLLVGQSPADFEARLAELAHSFGARTVRVFSPKPGRVVLEIVHIDQLVVPFPPPRLPEIGGWVDLRAVWVGYTESGPLWLVRLLSAHLLIAGSMGAGKASVWWSIVWAAAPAIRNGSVVVYGIDPKGGMEFGKCPAVFRKLVRSNGDEAVELLEDLAVQVRLRAAQLADMGRREWSPDCGLPLVILAVDELADIVAYQSDRKLRERANLALQTICSQGRAPGVVVIGQVQDPRKEIISFRHLFPVRIAMRLDEPVQVDMVLGEGVRGRGAFAHEIPHNMPGIAWVKVDGQREPERVRAFHVTDEYLDYLNHYVASGRPEVPPALQVAS